MEGRVFGLDFLLEMMLAVVLGGVIGIERELKDKPAGLRTHILICLGATLFTDLAQRLVGVGGDPGRLAGHVAAGVGFIGAGTILHQRGEVTGLTTAANVWVVAAIGMALGFGAYRDAIAATVVVVLVLAGLGHAERTLDRWASKDGRFEVRARAEPSPVEELRAAAAAEGLEIVECHVRREGESLRLDLRLRGSRARQEKALAALSGHAAVQEVSTAQ